MLCVPDVIEKSSALCVDTVEKGSAHTSRITFCQSVVLVQPEIMACVPDVVEKGSAHNLAHNFLPRLLTAHNF
jgi:hypothetical protein